MASPVRSRNPLVTWVLRLVVVAYLFMLIIWPSYYVVKSTFADGWSGVTEALSDPDVSSALQLSATVAVVAVVINLVFGVGIALLLVRKDFPGKRLLSALLDLPLAVSPVVVGLSLMLVYSPSYGWFGKPLDGAGIQIVFHQPGMVLATCFVALPLVIREIVPVLGEIGEEQEQAAKSLGASSWQTFWRITLPGIRWAVVYGVVLSLARSLGEFGAVKVVSGNVAGETQTATLLVQSKYQGFEQTTAYAVAFLLAFVSVVCLAIVFILRARGERRSS